MPKIIAEAPSKERASRVAAWPVPALPSRVSFCVELWLCVGRLHPETSEIIHHLKPCAILNAMVRSPVSCFLPTPHVISYSLVHCVKLYMPVSHLGVLSWQAIITSELCPSPTSFNNSPKAQLQCCGHRCTEQSCQHSTGLLVGINVSLGLIMSSFMMSVCMGQHSIF